MKVSILLHSILREKLPPEARGITVLELAGGARVKDVIEKLDLPARVGFALNEQIQRDVDQVLQDGDSLRFFRPGAGG
jgi:sulfur carrier protein ThiS